MVNLSGINCHKRLVDIPSGEILVRGTRYKDGREYPLEHCHRSVERALSELVLFELAYGGHFKSVGMSDTITVKTSTVGCADFTSFTGSVDDMEPLTNLANIMTKSLGGMPREAMLSFSSESDPLECAMCGLVGGQMTTRELLLTALYRLNLPYAKTKSSSVKDLLVVYTMLKVDKVSIDDVRELLENT